MIDLAMFSVMDIQYIPIQKKIHDQLSLETQSKKILKFELLALQKLIYN